MWQRLSAGEGTKGPRLYDWAYLEPADLDAADYDANRSGLWTRGLLIRRTIIDGELAFFSTWCPAQTPIETPVRVEGHRWAIEDSFETAKNELGLDHNETRSWHGWHRHVALVMLAFAMLAAIRHQANAMTPPKTKPGHGHSNPPHPLVASGNPPHRCQTCQTANSTRSYHRMVTLEKSPPSCRKTSSLKIENATVMLGRVII